jgi:hypothetical protein
VGDAEATIKADIGGSQVFIYMKVSVHVAHVCVCGWCAFARVMRGLSSATVCITRSALVLCSPPTTRTPVCNRHTGHA